MRSSGCCIAPSARGFFWRWLAMGSLAVLVCAGCAAGSDGDEGPEPVLRSGKGWTRNKPAFEDGTAKWGLDGLTLRSFAVADVDGDGWADIVSERAAYERDVGVIYLNRPDGKGGRTFVLDEDHPVAFPSREAPGHGRYMSIQTAGDVDNDGDVDLFVDEMDYPPADATLLEDGPDVLLNDGHGGFALGPVPRVVGPERPLTTGAFFLDQDLDGKLDLAVGYWWVQPPFTQPFGQQPQLLRGNGAGGFTDVTDAVGMTLLTTAASVPEGTNVRPLFAFTGCDVNDDGLMDLVGAAYGRMFNELFLADGDRYHEVARARGVASDQREDYSTDESYRCYCVQHQGEKYCEGAKPPPFGFCGAFGGNMGRGWQPGYTDQPYNLGGNTFTHVCEDFDNDGDFDLYESNIKHPDTGTASDPSELLVNDGTGHFARPGRETMGLTPPVDLTRIDEGGQQAAGWDFDNDGRLDIYLMGSPYPLNRGWLFHQKAEGTLQFEYAGVGAGLQHACPSGMALADFDHDGDEDIVVGTYGCNDAQLGDWKPPDNQPTRFYENVSNDANFISIRVVGKGGKGHANRSGLGARVRLTSGGVTQTRSIHGSWGQGDMSREEVAFFGLGKQSHIDRIEVRWPDAGLTTQTFTGVLANHRVELHEGESKPRYLP